MWRVFAFALLVVGVAAGQGGPRAYFPWWETPITERLGLSDEQREQIRSVLKSHRDEMIDQRAVVEKAEAEMEDLFAEEEFDQQQADRAIERLVMARGDLTRSLTKMTLELRHVLTTEQWRKLRSFQDRMEQFRGRRGFPRGRPGERSREPRRPDEPKRPPKPPEQL